MSFTPEQVTEILQIYFDNFVNQTYTGMRYVPIFGRRGESSIAWDNSEPYEPLTIVTYNNESYTSRQFVPAAAAITDTDYWVKTGAYNAQIAALQDALPIAQFDSENTVKDYVDTLASFIPASDFDNDNTVKAYIDNGLGEIADVLPYDAFDSVNTVRGAINSLKENINVITPEMYGAIGDGVTDDTQAIQDAFDYAKANNRRFEASGMYLITDTITFDNYNVFMKNSLIRYAGTRNKPAFSINGLKNIYEFGIIIDNDIYNATHTFDIAAGWHGWLNNDYVGIFVHNTNFCKISAICIVDFTVGMKLSDQNGWNTFNVQSIRNCKIGLEIENNTNSSWNNANKFSDFEINYGSSGTNFITANEDRICIYQHVESGADKSCNSNIFDNFKFEWHGTASYTCVKAETMKGCIFDNCRFELSGSGAKGFIIDLSIFAANTYALDNQCNYFVDKPSLSVTRPSGYIMPSDYEIMKFQKIGTSIWKKTFIDAINNDLAIKVQTNRNILKGRVCAAGLANSTYASKVYSVYTANQPFNNGALEGSISGGGIAYFIEMPTKCNLSIKTTNRLPSIQCFDANGDILTGNVVYSAEYGLPTNNASYNYTAASLATLHYAIVSFADTVKYAKFIISDFVNIEIMSDSEDTKIDVFPTTETNPMLNQHGFASDVVPNIFDNIPVYTIVYDMRSGHEGEYWQYEIVSNVQTWVSY